MLLSPHRFCSKTFAAKVMGLQTADFDAAVKSGELVPVDFANRKQARFSGAQLIAWVEGKLRRAEAAQAQAQAQVKS